MPRRPRFCCSSIMYASSSQSPASSKTGAPPPPPPPPHTHSPTHPLGQCIPMKNLIARSWVYQYCRVEFTYSMAGPVSSHLACRGVDFSDLLPAGMGGLQRAIERFDASKGFKFSTYAHWWIRQAVSRCIQV